jgi:hypothetical protein
MSSQFTYQEEAKQSKLVENLQEIRSLGTEVLQMLEEDRVETLVDFDRRLSSLNARRQRANRVNSPHRMVLFTVADLLDLNQAQTTASIRADVNSASLRERSTPADAEIRASKFTSTTGTIERLDLKSTLYRVHTTAGQIPTGLFELELSTPLQLTLLVFDTAATPGEPTITVETSLNGMTYTSAERVSRNGYRINAWINPNKVRFIRLSITPSHADALSGDSYTFGITSFHASGMEFHLRSDLVTRSLTFAPRSGAVKFVAEGDSGLTYFLALGLPGSNPPFIEVKSGDEIEIPGTAQIGYSTPLSVGLKGSVWTVTTALALGVFIRPVVPNGFIYEVTTAGTTGGSEPTWPLISGNTVVNGSVTFTTRVDGILNHVLPADTYRHTLKVTSDDDNQEVVTAVGLSYLDSRIQYLIHRTIGILGTEMRYVNYQAALDVGRTFTIKYETGPALVECRLKVQFSTDDRALTPTFHGASLEEL